MEWSILQQMQCLLQSVVLGMTQGLLLDLLTGMVRVSSRRRWMWTDIVFGPIAAVITFCGALVIMDGHLHPLLFLGVFWGMVTEHVTIGIWVCWAVRRIRKQICLWRGMFSAVGDMCRHKVRRLFSHEGNCEQNDEKV